MKKDKPEHRAASLLDQYVEQRLHGGTPDREAVLQRCPEQEREALREALDGVETVLDYFCDDQVSDELLDRTLASIAALQVRRRLVRRYQEEVAKTLSTNLVDPIDRLSRWFVTVGRGNTARPLRPLSPTVLNRGHSTVERSAHAALYVEEANLKILEATMESRVSELLSTSGIVRAPVDLAQIAKTLFLTIQEVPLDPLDGCLVTNGQIGVVLLNSNIKDVHRRRYTLGHECAHAVLHATQLAHRDGQEQLSNFDAGTEMQANVFCSHLLMPARFLPADFGKALPTFGLAEQTRDAFDVSFLAALWRHVRASHWECALVVVKDGVVQWSTRSPYFQGYIKKRPHPSCLAVQFMDADEWPLEEKAEWPIQFWIETDADDERDVSEQSRKLSGDYVYVLLSILYRD